MMFWLLPIIVFAPGTLAALVLAVKVAGSVRRDRRDIIRLEQLAARTHTERVVRGGPNVIPIWQAPSYHREATD